MSFMEVFEKELICSLQPNLNELASIWDYVGYTEAERLERMREFIKKFHSILLEVVNEENKHCLEMEQTIDSRRREIAELCKQLGLPPYLPPRGLTSQDSLQILNKKYERLIQIKKDRCETYMKLRSRVIQLGYLLNESEQTMNAHLQGMPSLIQTNLSDHVDEESDTHLPIEQGMTNEFKLDSIQTIPDESTIKKLEHIHDELESTYKPLTMKYDALKEDICRIASDINYQPDNENELKILQSSGLKYTGDHLNFKSTPGIVQKATEHVNSSHLLYTNGSPKIIGCTSEILREPIVTNETLQWLTDWRLKLVKEKARLVGTCEELREYLQLMWRRLSKPECEQTLFLKAHSGYKPEVLEALQEEVDKCQQMKWENMNTYIECLESEAMYLAETCCIDPSVVIEIKNDSSNNKDPELMVNQLETLLEKLNKTYASYKPVYESIAAYELYWKQLLEVETKLKDPAIFSNRGGILLKTEKEKKRLLKELERSEKDAFNTIEQYESKSSNKFCLSDGRTFTEHVNDKWSLYRNLLRDSTRSSRRSFAPNTSSPTHTLSNNPASPSHSRNVNTAHVLHSSTT